MKFLSKYILSTLAFLIVVLGLNSTVYANNNSELYDENFTIYTYSSLDELNLMEFNFLHIYEIVDDEAIRLEVEEISDLQFIMSERIEIGTSFLAVGGRITERRADITLINLTTRNTLTNIVAHLRLRDHSERTLAGATRRTNALGPNGFAPESIVSHDVAPVSHLEYDIDFNVLGGAQGLNISDTVYR